MTLSGASSSLTIPRERQNRNLRHRNADAETSSLLELPTQSPHGRRPVSCHASHSCLLDHDPVGWTASPIRRQQARARADKMQHLRRMLERRSVQQISLEKMRHLACSAYGLVDDDYRARFWPVLADNLLKETDEDVANRPSSSSAHRRHRSPDAQSHSISDSDFESALSELSEHRAASNGTATDDEEDDEENEFLEELKSEDLRQHPEWNQVQLDVDRTLARFPPNITDDERGVLQEQLTPIIVKVLSSDPKFKYYQGFHDVCLTLLLVLGTARSAYETALRLAHDGPFAAYLRGSLENTVIKELELLYVVMWRADARLERLLRTAELGQLFALSWPLTWFAHVLQSHEQTTRVWDACLAMGRLFPVYLAAAIVLYRKPEIVAAARDMPTLHALLSHMPDRLPIDALISDALYLWRLVPPAWVVSDGRSEYTARCRRHTASLSSSSSRQHRVQNAISRYTLQAAVVAGGLSVVAGYFWLSHYGSLPSL